MTPLSKTCPRCQVEYQATLSQCPRCNSKKDTGWYVALAKRKVGPYSLAQLQQMAATGQIPPDTMVFHDGEVKWLPFSSVAYLFQPTVMSESDFGLPIGDWYLALNKTKLGPYNYEQLQQFAIEGKIKPTDMALKSGTIKWQPVSSIPGLFSSRSEKAGILDQVKQFRKCLRRHHFLYLVGGVAGVISVLAGILFHTSTDTAQPLLAPHPVQKTTAANKQIAPGSLGESRGLDILHDHHSNTDYYRSTYAIIIGVDQYSQENGLSRLQYAVNDAREVRTILHAEFGYAAERIRFITDKSATKESIREAFEEWLPQRQLQADDAVLFFFAGHGVIQQSNRDGYLVPVDGKTADLPETCVSMAWVRDQLRKLPCRHKLAILDSCYSGSLFLEGPSPAVSPANEQLAGKGVKPPKVKTRSSDASNALSRDNIRYYLQQPAFLGLSAGRFTPVADGSGKDRHSVFTSSLLKVLRERANSLRGDHVFTFRQLAAQTEAEVANFGGSTQIPDWGRLDSGDGDFVFRPTLKRLTPNEVAYRREYARDIRLAQEALESGNVEQTKRLLKSYLPVLGREDLRGFEWFYLNGLCRTCIGTFENKFDGRFLAISSDGKRIAIRQTYYVAKIYETATHRELVSINRHEGIVESVSFSCDGKRLVSGDTSGTIMVWDQGATEPIHVIKGDSPSVSLKPRTCMSPDGTKVVYDRGIGAAKLFDLVTNKEVPVSELGAVSFAFNPDGKYLAYATTSSKDRSLFGSRHDLKVMCLANGRNVFSIQGISSYFISFSANGKYLASESNGLSADDPGEIKVWDFKSGQELWCLKGHKGRITGFCFNQDSTRIVSAAWTQDQRNEIKIWDLNTGQEAFSLDGPEEMILGLVYNLSDSVLAASGKGFSKDAELFSWNLKRSNEPVTILGHEGAIGSVLLVPNSSNLAALFQTGSIIHSPLPGMGFGGGQVEMPGGGSSFLQFREATWGLKVWDINLSSEISKLNKVDVYVRNLAFTKDGEQIAWPIDREKSGFAIWDIKTSRRSTNLTGAGLTVKENGNHEWAFSADGRWLARKWALDIQLLDRVSGKETFLAKGSKEGLTSILSFCPEGRCLAVASSHFFDRQGEMQLLEVPTGNVVFSAPGAYYQAAFSHNADILVSRGRELHLKVWNVRDGFKVTRLSGHKDFILDFALSPDGRRVATASADKTVKVWDPAIGECLVTLRGHANGVSCVDFSSDGGLLISGSQDKTIRVWKGRR